MGDLEEGEIKERGSVSLGWGLQLSIANRILERERREKGEERGWCIEKKNK